MSTTTVTFAGNLGADPELRFTPNGNPVTQLRVIVNRRTRTSAGEWEDVEPTGHSCKVWGTAAEHVAESAIKGTRVLVHGHLETETWTDKDSGDKRTRDVVVVEEIGLSLTWNAAHLAPNPTTAGGEHTQQA